MLKYLKLCNYTKRSTKHLIVNLALAVLGIIIVSLIEEWSVQKHPIDFITRLHNEQIDQLIKTDLSNRSWKKQDENSKLHFIEIDTDVLQSWKAERAPVVPRDKLKSLLIKLNTTRPKVVFLDIFLDYYSNPYNLSQEDKELQETIRTLIETSDIKFIFPIKITSDEMVHYPYFRDYLKKYENENVVYGIPTTYKYEGDTKERYLLYHRDVNQKRYYSVVLYSYLLMNGISPNNLDKQDGIKINNRYIKFKNRISLNDRIRFFLLDPKRYAIFPGDISNTKATDIHSSSLPAGSLVYIGGNSPWKGDMKDTPVGKMAGVYLLGNCYLTVVNEQMAFSPWKYPILIAISIFLALFFTYIESRYSFYIKAALAMSLYYLGVYLFESYSVFMSSGVVLFYMSKYQRVLDFIDKHCQK
jgi:CHASE2 domain-containing sensor protein